MKYSARDYRTGKCLTLGLGPLTVPPYHVTANALFYQELLNQKIKLEERV